MMRGFAIAKENGTNYGEAHTPPCLTMSVAPWSLMPGTSSHRSNRRTLLVTGFAIWWMERHHNTYIVPTVRTYYQICITMQPISVEILCPFRNPNALFSKENWLSLSPPPPPPPPPPNRPPTFLYEFISSTRMIWKIRTTLKQVFHPLYE